MSRVVGCHQCGAPHRPARGQTRFTCDWCGTENLAAEERRTEELVVRGACDAERARRRAIETLERRGVRRPRANAQPPRWIEMWQVVSDEGEEYVHVVGSGVGLLTHALRLPAAELARIDDDNVRPIAMGRPGSKTDGSTVLAAARATFEHPDAALRSVRRIWWPVCDVHARVGGARVRGLFLGGNDAVIFEPLPSGATAMSARTDLLTGYALHVAIALALGMAIPSVPARTVVLASWCATGIVLWNLASRPRGRRR